MAKVGNNNPRDGGESPFFAPLVQSSDKRGEPQKPPTLGALNVEDDDAWPMPMLQHVQRNKQRLQERRSRRRDASPPPDQLVLLEGKGSTKHDYYDEDEIGYECASSRNSGMQRSSKAS